MGYYYSYPYEFSSHALVRCRERLNLRELDDFLVRQKAFELIKNSNFQFETENNLYIRVVEKNNIFFVVNKRDRVIITCSPISVEKQFSLILSDNR